MARPYVALAGVDGAVLGNLPGCSDALPPPHTMPPTPASTRAHNQHTPTCHTHTCHTPHARSAQRTWGMIVCATSSPSLYALRIFRVRGMSSTLLIARTICGQARTQNSFKKGAAVSGLAMQKGAECELGWHGMACKHACQVRWLASMPVRKLYTNDHQHQRYWQLPIHDHMCT